MQGNGGVAGEVPGPRRGRVAATLVMKRSDLELESMTYKLVTQTWLFGRHFMGKNGDKIGLFSRKTTDKISRAKLLCKN